MLHYLQSQCIKSMNPRGYSNALDTQRWPCITYCAVMSQLFSSQLGASSVSQAFEAGGGGEGLLSSRSRKILVCSEV